MDQRRPRHRHAGIRPFGPGRGFAVAAIVLVAAACGTTPSPTSTPAVTFPSPTPTATAASTAVATEIASSTPESSAPAGTPSPSPVATTPPPTVSPLPTHFAAPSGSPTITDTGVTGRIWDALPKSFPIYPGLNPSSPAEPGAWSASLETDSVTADTLATWYDAVLRSSGYATQASGKLEGGERTIDATIGNAGCAVSMSFQPRDTMTLMLIRYGAACTFE